MNNENNVENVTYATIGERFVALFHDWLHIWWIALIVWFGFGFLSYSIKSTNADLANILTVFKIMCTILSIAIGQPLYAMFAEGTKDHITIGMKKKNIKVVNKNGKLLTFGDSVLRTSMKYLFLSIPFGFIINIITICCTRKKQALYDMVLSHTVIKNI